MTEPAELFETTGVDAWAAWVPGQDLVPAYLVSPFAAQYRAVVEVMLDAQDTSLTGLSYDEVAAALRVWLGERVDAVVADRLTDPDGFALEARLERLVRWGVLTRWQEPARTGEDFLRRRDRYQLTPIAARLHSFWSSELGAEEDAAADLTLAPRAIRDRLSAFAEAIADRNYPAAASEFQQIITLHHGMAVAARSWQRSLAHALSGGPDPDKQDVLWRTLQSYIGMWGEQVDIHTPAVADLIAELGPQLTTPVWQACVRGALAEDAADELVQRQLQRWVHTWNALREWFAGADGQARRLRKQLRDLVAPWARNMHILMDTGGALSRRGELLTLAQAIEQAPDDRTAVRMWDTATGVFAARHFLIAAEASEDNASAWADAAPAPITARFREHGHRAAVGKRPAAIDNAAGRSAARQARAAALAAQRQAEATLSARSGTSMVDWEPLSEQEFGFLRDLLSVARGGAARSAVTEDGRWQVNFTSPDDESMATLYTPDGRFITRNWHFELASADSRRADR
ncbi:DUF2397 domain-containing protein [Nocardia sp. NPDC058666]|uniref:DUF2397 domain-containing protein n=1 Tax=Nocardia sp. NPDC058666 TaxID=3346587 RepID=UPI0036653074